MSGTLCQRRMTAMISGFSDAPKWAVKDNAIVYVPQDRSYKEVLLGGTPIEYFAAEDTPTCVIGVKPRLRSRKTRAKDLEEAVRTYDHQEWDTQIITSGEWVDLTREEILALPWVQRSIADPFASIGINQCWGYECITVPSDGKIVFTVSGSYQKVSCGIRKNIKKETRLKLKWEHGRVDALKFASVDGGRAGRFDFFWYDKQGNPSDIPVPDTPPAYDDDDDEDDGWDDIDYDPDWDDHDPGTMELFGTYIRSSYSARPGWWQSW